MIIVLSGLTATGKTALLHSLAETGEQILDLEALAGHHGSAFGNLDRIPQPSHHAFQESVTAILDAADAKRPLWVEDESDYLGSVGLPPRLIAAIGGAPCVEVVAPVAVRIARIVAEYGRHARDNWAAAVSRIASRLGPSRTGLVEAALATDDLAAAVTVLLDYYDAGNAHRSETPDREVLTAVDPTHDGVTCVLACLGEARVFPAA